MWYVRLIDLKATRHAYPEVLKGQDICCGVELAVNLHECVFVSVQLKEGVMFDKHLDNDLCTIRVGGTCHFQKPCTTQAREKTQNIIYKWATVFLIAGWSEMCPPKRS